MQGQKKILIYAAIVFFVTLIILFFILEFRFIKKIIDKNDANVRQIVSSELNIYWQGLQNKTNHTAELLSHGDGTATSSLLQDIAARNQDIMEIYLLDAQGYVVHSLSGNEIGMLKSWPESGYEIVKNHRVVGLGLTASIMADAHIIIEYSTSDFENEFLLKYTADKFKVGVLGREGDPLVWPFKPEVFSGFDLAQDTIKAQNTTYLVHQAQLKNSPFTVVFFNEDTRFDTYRVITIMLLLFTLYFLIYQFIVELLKLNNISFYFDHIDFNIFNNLKEGIIIANQFGKVVFANNIIHELFAEKNIVLKETELKDITGPIDGPHRMTLKKSGDLLEIIRSPLIKNGRLLGSLVVISPGGEKEKLCRYALGDLVELLPEGVLFVDKENKIVTFNLMASYYLGQLTPEKNIEEINSQLANTIESNIGSSAVTRAQLAGGNMHCQLKPVYDKNGFYVGTIVLIKEN